MNKKKYLFYCPGIYPEKTGGMEIYYYYLFRNIQNKYKNEKWFLMTSSKKLASNNKNYIYSNNKLFFISRFGIGAFSTLIYYTFSKKFNWRKFTTLVVPYTSNFKFNILPFLLLKFFFNVKYIIHIHGGRMEKWKYSFVQKLFFKNALNIFGVSNAIVKEYSERINKKVKILPPLIPFIKNKDDNFTIKQNIKIEDFDKIILFVGSIKPLKCPNILVEAIEKIGLKFLKKHRVCCLFLGDGPMKNELNNYIIKNNLDKNIKFLGNIDNQIISKYYSLSDIFVIPSLFEGNPISLFEAQFNGLVCVGSNVKGINDVIRNNKNGLLFEKNNSEELSKILKRIILNKAEVIKLKNSAINFFNTNYNYDNHLNDFYKGLNN